MNPISRVIAFFGGKKESFVCFSSGHTPLYRLGVLESLGMPNGSMKWFRYTLKKSVSGTIRKRIDTGLLEGAEILICYLDQSNREIDPIPVPVRYARIVRVEHDDPKLYILLKYGDFALIESGVDFRSELIKNADFENGEGVPIWDDAAATEPKGLYCFKLKGSLKAVKHVHSLQDWAQIAEHLRKHADFQDVSAFYRIEGLIDDRHGRRAIMEQGEFVVGGGTTYRSRVYYYAPESSHVVQVPIRTETQFMNVTAEFNLNGQIFKATRQVKLTDAAEPQTEELQLITQSDRFIFVDPPFIQVRSRMDRVDVRLTTTPGWWGDSTTLSLVRPDDERKIPQLAVPIRVKVNIWGTAVLVIAVAAAAAAGPLTTVLLKDTFSWEKYVWLIIGIVFVAVISGVVGIMKLRKLG
jgi:hypothetical protein